MALAFALAAVFVVLLAAYAVRPKPRGADGLPKPANDVQQLVTAGRKVAAIKAYRKQTGASLLEATQVIEGYVPSP